MRILQERLVDENERPIEEWGPAYEHTHREALRHLQTDADFRRYVREWNRKERAAGNFIRIRSIEIEEGFGSLPPWARRRR